VASISHDEHSEEADNTKTRCFMMCVREVLCVPLACTSCCGLHLWSRMCEAWPQVDVLTSHKQSAPGRSSKHARLGDVSDLCTWQVSDGAWAKGTHILRRHICLS
jgi:hypothetical protein